MGYINEKNITYKRTVNYFKSVNSLRCTSTVKLSHIANEITDGTRVKRDYTDYGVKIINAGDFKDGTIYSKTVKCVSTEGIKDKDYIKEIEYRYKIRKYINKEIRPPRIYIFLID